MNAFVYAECMGYLPATMNGPAVCATRPSGGSVERVESNKAPLSMAEVRAITMRLRRAA